MAQFIPARNEWANAFRSLGEGTVEGYTTGADERAIQNAVGKLGPNPSARQLLDAITQTKTYSPQAKQNILRNYLGISQFEELQKQNEQARELAYAKRTIEDNEKKEKKQLEVGNARALIDTSDLPEDQKEQFRKQIDEGSLGIQAVKEIIKPAKENTKTEEKVAAIETGLRTIDRMLELGAKGNLGRGSNIFKHFGGETAKDFGEYEQLGKSLIQLSTSIPIRNRQEFETLAHNLYDPTLPDVQREGILNALKSILRSNLGQQEASTIGEKPAALSQGRIRVRNKQTGKVGTVTPFEGMESKYERLG